MLAKLMAMAPAEMVPLLLTPPEKVETVLTFMPLPPTEMVPELLMPP